MFGKWVEAYRWRKAFDAHGQHICGLLDDPSAWRVIRRHRVLARARAQIDPKWTPRQAAWFAVAHVFAQGILLLPLNLRQQAVFELSHGQAFGALARNVRALVIEARNDVQAALLSPEVGDLIENLLFGALEGRDIDASNSVWLSQSLDRIIASMKEGSDPP